MIDNKQNKNKKKVENEINLSMRKFLAGILHLINIKVSIFYHSAEFDFILNVNHVRLILYCVFAHVSCTNKMINEALSYV